METEFLKFKNAFVARPMTAEHRQFARDVCVSSDTQRYPQPCPPRVATGFKLRSIRIFGKIRFSRVDQPKNERCQSARGKRCTYPNRLDLAGLSQYP